MTLRESLPSQETSGQAPYTHQDGAGALPGTKREAGVAVLPDESGGPRDATAATSSATGTHARDWSGNPAVARPGEEAGSESLGAGERRVGRDVSGGVGALVGGKGEEGVAVLPDERGRTTGGTPSAAEGGKGDKLGEMDQAEREERHRVAGTQKQAPSKVSGRSISGVSMDVDGAGLKDLRGGCEDQGRGRREEGRETQMNLLEVNLQPRTHPLGTPEATWRGVGVGVASGYTHGEGVDIGRRGFDETPAEEVRRPGL